MNAHAQRDNVSAHFNVKLERLQSEIHMNRLSDNWLTDGLLDNEYKEYLLLAWLQKVKREFKDARLYPALAQLIEEHRKLTSLQSSQNAFTKAARKPLKGLDFEKMRLVYQDLEDHPELNSYLNTLIQFSIPRIEDALREGKDLYELVEEHLELSPVGIMPLYRKEGYLFLYDEPRKEIYAFRYAHSRIERMEENFHTLETQLVDRRRRKLSQTFEQLKIELIKRFTDLPNPATYLVRSDLVFPLSETLLPIARRRLMLELKRA